MKYFKIGEISRMKNITVKALRFYEKVGLLIPANVDPYTGYRYYSSDQLFRVEMIQYLRSLDIPIADMKYLFQHADLHTWSEFFGKLQEMMDQKVEALFRSKNTLSRFQKHIGDIEKMMNEPHLYLRHIDSRCLLVSPCTEEPSTAEAVGKFQRLYQTVSEGNLNTSYQSGSLYRCPEPYQSLHREEIFLDIDQSMKREGTQYKTIPGGTYLCLNHCYHDYDTAVSAILHFVRRRKLHPLLVVEQEAFLDFIGYTRPLASLQILLNKEEIPQDLPYADE